jgi:hypothetical protein
MLKDDQLNYIFLKQQQGAKTINMSPSTNEVSLV